MTDLLDINITPPRSTPEETPPEAAATAGSIDVTLLRGLEPALSPEEQAHLTSLLTSGNPDDLATAAKVFHDVGVMLKAGVASPSQRSDYQRLQLQESFSTFSINVSKYPKSRPGYNDREERVADEKKINDVEKAEKARALPLPVRMPRMIVLSSAFDATSTKKKPLTFVDDPWDGTLGAAFTKLEVHSDAKGLSKILPAAKQKASSHVAHVLKFSPGFDTIVDSIPGGYSAQLVEGIAGSTDQPRVLIATVAKEAAKLGLAQRGDVVTHVNGKQFTGTAQELNDLITSLHQENNENHLEIVFNAELCIAKALQLRANLMG
jgi:hypothetical protein